MSTKTSLFLITAVLLIIGGVASYLVFFSQSQTLPSTETEVENDPFGNAPDISSGSGSISGGNNQTGSGTDSPDENNTGSGTSTSSKRALLKITSEPVSGFSFAYIRRLISATSSRKEYATTTLIRFVEKATGHVVEYALLNEELRKLTTTRLPKNSESLFYNNGERVVIRWFDADSRSIQSYDGKLPSLGLTMGELDGSFLPENISVVSTNGKNLFYGYKNNASFLGFIRDGVAKDKKIIDHPFSEWLAQSIDDMVILTTKPSYLFAGTVYALSLKTGDLTKLIGPENSLTALSTKDGKEILFGNSGGALSLLRVSTKTTRSVPLRTLPEKCVWGDRTMIAYCAVPKEGSSFSAMPDRWYKGAVSFSDTLFMVDAYGEGILTQEIGALQNIDVEKISISENGQYLLFTNKKDGSLWIFDTTLSLETAAY